MKKDIHQENYRYVVFQDSSCDYSFLTRSTVETKETIKWKDGKEYPLYKLDKKRFLSSSGLSQKPNFLSKTPVTRLKPDGITLKGSLTIYNILASPNLFKNLGQLALIEKSFATFCTHILKVV